MYNMFLDVVKDERKEIFDIAIALKIMLFHSNGTFLIFQIFETH